MTITETNPSSRNGVDTATLFATLDAVKQAPAAAQFQFRARNDWVNGTHNRSTISDFFGVGEERAHERTFVFDADHPAVLVGHDNGPTPVEFVLHALAVVPHRRPGEHRRRPQGHPDRGPLDGHRRHRPERHPRPQPRGAQRLPADQRQVHRQG